MKTLYQCEVCQKVYDYAPDALNCESQPSPLPPAGVRVGQLAYIKNTGKHITIDRVMAIIPHKHSHIIRVKNQHHLEKGYKTNLIPLSFIERFE